MRAPLEAAPVVTPARIRYRDDQPYSLDYGDIYHAADGDAEVRRVFLEPCRVAGTARERARRPGPASMVRIGELGFGSGLNFVLAAETCLDAGCRLHFVSVEAHPIDAGDFAPLAARRSARHPLYRELAARYPPRIRGWHRRDLAGGRVSLLLYLGDAYEALSDLDGRQRQPMDAWFLDGFAPDRNPALWEPALFHRLAALSGAHTRAATFTAAGRVRRGLEAAGFTMTRVDQRPFKRESLAGVFQRNGLRGFEPPRAVDVAGAGLAGAAAAWRLARAGFEVSVRDGGADAAAPPASSMPVTALHARLLDEGTDQAALRCHGYLHAAALLTDLPGFRATGVLQLPGGTQTAAKLAALAGRYAPSGPWLRWLDPDAAATLAGWPAPAGGLHLPGAGLVDTPALVKGLLDHGNIEFIPEALGQPAGDGPVVLACGPATGAFAGARYLEIAAVQGQLDLVDLAPAPRLPLVGGRYLLPARGALTAVGSTYEHSPWAPDQATRHNLAQLEGAEFRWARRCRGTRTVSSDRIAVAGPLYDAQGRSVPDVLVSTGHGSAGNVSAHLAAAVIEAHLLGDCPPLTAKLEALLSPRRFRDRQARRGQRPRWRVNASETPARS